MHPLDPRAVLRAQAGDGPARERLLAALEPLLRGFFVNRIGRVPDVDDLVQNALLRIHRTLDTLQQPDRLKPVAMKAALFELQDHYRGRYSTREVLYDPDTPPPHATDPVDSALKLDLDRALATLSPHARRIIELRELGYPYLEIAELLGTTEAAVKMQVKRAFERLRESLSALASFVLALTPLLS